MREFHDFVRILERRPDWREELRRLILTDELLKLPQVVRELVEAQRRTEEELKTLTARVDSLTQRVDSLAVQMEALTSRVDSLTRRVDSLTAQMEVLTARVDSLTQRVDFLAAQMEALTARVDSLTQRVDSLAAQMEALTARVDSLTEAQVKTEETLRRLGIDVAELKGDSLERKYREKAPAYFGPLLRRAKSLSADELWDIVDRGIEEGVLTSEEAREVLDTDIVVRGRRWKDGKEEYLVVEVSWGVGVTDVERAVRRAELLRKLGLEVRAVVAGRGITSEAKGLAAEKGVERVIDGRVFFEGG